MDDYDQVKARVRFKIQSQVKAKLVNELKGRYGVTYAESKGTADVPKVEPAGDSMIQKSGS